MEARSTAHENGAELAGIDYGSGPPILLFADDSSSRERIGGAVVAAGGRLSVAMALYEAVARIEAHAAPAGVVVDIGPDQTGIAEEIFDAIEQGARSQRFRSVAIIDPAMIDLAAARAGHSDVQLMCRGSCTDLAAALGELIVPRGMLLSDVSTDAAPIKLRELSEEVGRIARTLAALSSRQPDERGLFRGNGNGVGNGDGTSELIVDAPALRGIIRARRLRDQFFNSEIFADPAWDMLLDLMAAQIEGRPVAVSSLCIAAAVPPTTALRWIKTMTDLGMFIRVADPDDRRRVFIELAPRSADAMIGYLGGVRKVCPMPL